MLPSARPKANAAARHDAGKCSPRTEKTVKQPIQQEEYAMKLIQTKPPMIRLSRQKWQGIERQAGWNAEAAPSRISVKTAAEMLDLNRLNTLMMDASLYAEKIRDRPSNYHELLTVLQEFQRWSKELDSETTRNIQAIQYALQHGH
jgi:hypothetical protein